MADISAADVLTLSPGSDRKREQIRCPQIRSELLTNCNRGGENHFVPEEIGSQTNTPDTKSPGQVREGGWHGRRAPSFGTDILSPYCRQDKGTEMV
ncbi:hypothetical protein J6590_034421 [Homalodisca vitripennis]|nr:hypothetical protein J6590_034421 [Homalodisca vitripennis]